MSIRTRLAKLEQRPVKKIEITAIAMIVPKDVAVPEDMVLGASRRFFDNCDNYGYWIFPWGYIEEEAKAAWEKENGRPWPNNDGEGIVITFAEAQEICDRLESKF